MSKLVRTCFYQLWCYYETNNEWKMEGLYQTYQKAEDAVRKLRNDVETMSMPDWAVVEVTGYW